jgi:ParB family chromosome partitioning protein
MSAETRKRGLGRGLDALFQDVRTEEESFQPKLRRADEIAVQQAPAHSHAQHAQTHAQHAQHAHQAQTQTAPNQGYAAAQRRLPVEKLTPGKFQPRRYFSDEALDQLAESISAHGVLQPLLVRPISGSMYEIIAGERRWRAAQKAQVHDVPVVVQELSDADALEIALIENLQREDLTGLEEAEGYQRLIDDFGHTQEALARQLGKSRSHVANMLRLLKLPESVQAMIQDGRLSSGHARALVGARNPEELAEAILRRSLNVRQTEALVQKTTVGKLKPAPRKKAFIAKDVDVLALEELTSAKLGLKVTIDSDGPAGKLTIAYKTLDQLDDLLARLGQAPKKP